MDFTSHQSSQYSFPSLSGKITIEQKHLSIIKKEIVHSLSFDIIEPDIIIRCS